MSAQCHHLAGERPRRCHLDYPRRARPLWKQCQSPCYGRHSSSLVDGHVAARQPDCELGSCCPLHSTRDDRHRHPRTFRSRPTSTIATTVHSATSSSRTAAAAFVASSVSESAAATALTSASARANVASHRNGCRLYGRSDAPPCHSVQMAGAEAQQIERRGRGGGNGESEGSRGGSIGGDGGSSRGGDGGSSRGGDGGES